MSLEEVVVLFETSEAIFCHLFSSLLSSPNSLVTSLAKTKSSSAIPLPKQKQKIYTD